MKVAYYISELLFANDCVIVPGFGGFVGNYAPAKIHPVNHTFYPPSKSILFNSKLLSDDGLLLHSISMGEGILYEQARQMVDEFIHQCMHSLNEGKTLKLERIGKLRLDSDGRYLFDPDTTVNYLEESYGLPTFISPPIQRSPMHKRLEKKFADRRPRPASELKNKKVYWVGVVLVPVLLLAGWIIFNPASMFKGTQQSSVITISEPEVNPVLSGRDDVKMNPGSSEQPKEIKPSESEDAPEAAINPTKDAVKNPVSTFYVIGGAFKIRENADKMLAGLRGEGYPAEDAGQSPAGLYMVSYFSSEDRSEALVNLAAVRREKNPSAWLLKK
jgi:nucleoid DNA-binding protein